MTTMTTSHPGPAISVTRPAQGVRRDQVLDGIDLTVEPGTVYALLGPNGAGKTTTVQILSTLIPADAGEISVAGHDLATESDSVRAAIGVTGQFSAVDDLLTGRENLQLMADLLHLGRAEGRSRVARAAEPVRADRRGRPGGVAPIRAACAGGWTWP